MEASKRSPSKILLGTGESPEPEKEPSFVVNLRDRLSFFVEEHKDLLYSLACGLAMGWAAFLACSEFPTLLTAWSIPIGIGILVLAVVELWTASAVMALVCTVQVLQFHPELGWTTAALSLVFLLLCPFGHGKACGLLVAPFLTGLGLGIALPIGYGLGQGKKSGWFWTVVAFGYVTMHAILFGNPKVGVPKESPLWEVIYDQSAGQVEGFTWPWLKSIFNSWDFEPLLVEAQIFIAQGSRWISLMLQLLLWLGVAVFLGYLFVRKRMTDKMALAYLEKANAVKKVPNYRKLPGAVAAGTLLFMVGYFILSQVFPEIVYRPVPEVVLHLAAAVGVMIPLYVVLEGNPEAGKSLKGRRMAIKAGLVSKKKRPAPAAGKAQGKPAAAIGSSNFSTEALRRKVKGAPKLPKKDLDVPSSGSVRRQGTFAGSAGLAGSRTGAGSEAQLWAVGEKIDNQYSIINEHIGGMGIVYEVVDDFSGKKYAVKTLREDFLQNEEAIERFGVEAKTWVNLDHHPNIVQAMLFRVVAGRPLLFLEFVDGTDLDRLQKEQGPFSVEQVLDWARQICSGMAYAHGKNVGGGRKGVIHRDLKPANLMLTREGVVKVTDFGLAKVSDTATHLTRQSTGLGTLAYMPPEQLEDARHVDKRADIYAFGAVLYELLTGSPPVTGESVANLTMNIISKMAQAPSTRNAAVPPQLDAVVLKCLQKEKTRRYHSFEALRVDLDGVPVGPEMQGGAGMTASSMGRRPPTSSRVSTSGASGISSRFQRTGSGSSSFSTAIEAILFIDMVGSTAMGSKYGDDYILQMKERLGNMVNIESNRQGVLFSKGTGDGFMLTFPEAINAVRAASGILNRTEEHNSGIPVTRALQLRMGIHFGQVNIDSTGDRQGTSVNLAARIEDAKTDQLHETRLGIQKDQMKKANRILISEVVHDEIQGDREFRSRLVGYFDFEGISGRQRIYELIWKKT